MSNWHHVNTRTCRSSSLYASVSPCFWVFPQLIIHRFSSQISPPFVQSSSSRTGTERSATMCPKGLLLLLQLDGGMPWCPSDGFSYPNVLGQWVLKTAASLDNWELMAMGKRLEQYTNLLKKQVENQPDLETFDSGGMHDFQGPCWVSGCTSKNDRKNTVVSPDISTW